MRDLIVTEWLKSKYGALMQCWWRDDHSESICVCWSDDDGLTLVWEDGLSLENYAKELVGHQPLHVKVCLAEVRFSGVR